MLSGLREIDGMDADEAYAFAEENEGTFWTCNSEERAQWCAAKLAAIAEDKARRTVAADAYITKQQQRLDALLKAREADLAPLIRAETFFAEALGSYVRAQCDADPKGQKTRRFGCATVKVRKRADSFEYPDSAALLAIVQSAGLRDCVKELLAWSATKKHLEATPAGVVLTDTGEVLPSDTIRFVPGGNEATVTVDLPG
jgi:hypothetical protein